ncbi:MAG TPA: type II toxin-antitoxin system HicB family antitoxin [Bacteroidales bacterium]
MLKYLIIFEKTETGYSSYAPDLPGCIATGKTKAIVEKNIIDAIRFHLDRMKAEKIAFPINRTDAETFVFAI